MTALVPLVVAVPLLGAAATILLSLLVRRRSLTAFPIAVAAATTGMTAALLLHVAHGGPVTYWFAGLHPHGGPPLGIDFVVGPISAATAAFAALLVTVALISSGRYVLAGGPVFAALMLLFQAAMVGFALSGDLFDIFVFFELMTATGIALSAYAVRERGPLGGGLSMAVSNSVGAFLILTGIALLYGRVGALNLAQIGAALGHGGPVGAPVIVAFGLIVSGFLVKAAAVPFHFWLADTYSMAPAPVCLLFSGIMSELGLYAIARIYWGAFEPGLGGATEGLRAVLVSLGALTALVGAAMSLAQAHLKRMLAFVTTSFIGLFLIGVGLLTPEGLGGAAVYVLADGLLKASLFVAVGAVEQHLGSVDQRELHGRGRPLRVSATLFVLGALGLAAIPPFGPFVGKALLEDAGGQAGYHWISAIVILAEALTGGAVLAAAGRVFWGRGERWAADGGRDAGQGGEEEAQGSSRWMLAVPAGLLMAAALAVGFIPDLATAATRAAGVFETHARLGAAGAPPHVAAIAFPPLAYVYAGISTLGSLLVAWIALTRPLKGREAAERALAPALRVLGGLRALHSGHDGEYLAWLTVGATLLTGAFALVLH